MIQKLKTLLVVLSLIAGLSVIFAPRSVLADPVTTLKPSDCKSTGVSEKGPTAGQVCKKDPATCASGRVDVHNSDPKQNDDSKCEPLGTNPVALKDNSIVKDLNLIVGFLSGLVGVVVVGVIILGGIQYSLAGDKAEAVSAAKKRITNAVVALVAFLFIFAFLQWLIPGGIFS